MPGTTTPLLCLASLSLLLEPGRAGAEGPACKETCQTERARLQKKLEECLRDVDPRPPDRAAKMRLLCRQRYSPPRCDDLPPCAKEKKAPAMQPGMTVGAMVFSAERRGPALSRPSYAPGSDVFLRVEVEVRPRPNQNRIELRMDLRLVEGKGQGRVVARWDSYAEEQRVIDPGERGLPLRFTLHGGAKLPPDTTPGSYRMEGELFEQIGKLRQGVSGGFEVRRGAR